MYRGVSYSLQTANLSWHPAPVFKPWIMNNSIDMRCKLVESGINSSGETIICFYFRSDLVKALVPNITNEEKKTYPHTLSPKSIVIHSLKKKLKQVMFSKYGFSGNIYLWFVHIYMYNTWIYALCHWCLFLFHGL